MDDTTGALSAPLTTAQQLIELRTGRTVRELLMDLYVHQGKSEVAIAQELGITRPTVRQWLGEFGLKRRRAA